MKILLLAEDGRPAADAVADALQGAVDKMQRCGRAIGASLAGTVKQHFSDSRPGSSWYSPSKVTEGASSGNVGEAVVDVPGITRAYHDLTIHPRTAQALTIPMHRAAYGKKASEIDGLFTLKKKDGKAFLVKREGSKLAFMYFLAKVVN